jgi:membrane-bound ClpP family serine protease
MSTLGILLVFMGAALMVAEAHVASHGVLGTGAALALAGGVALALSGAGAPIAVTAAAGVAVAATGLVLAWVLLVKSLATRRMAVRTGSTAMLGRVATVRAVPAPVGQVLLDGALWRARFWDFDDEDRAEVAEGSAVVVEAVNGITLTVRPAEEWEVLR